jgi:tetratricopeptide (TPR) repeat protein
VRAGLAILDAVRRLKVASGVTLQARVGIATGLVVVGEPLGTGNTGQRVAIGETPDVAALLQAAASPGEVVIAASTRRLVGRMFDCHPLGIVGIAGLPQAVEAWQVRGDVAGVSRFEARRVGTLSPLVGRQEEIDRLLRRWDQARRGEGQVVLLSGEPGIGKSRIAEDLLERLEGEWQACLRYFCSPHYSQSPLHPFVAQLEASAGFESDSDAGARLDRLEALLGPTSRNAPRDVALLAELLEVPADGRFPALAASPQQKREMILTALLDRLDSLAAKGPVLIVFEDVHWIDPTSQELLDRLVARAAERAVLLVVTMRPELHPAWIGEPQVTTLPLSRLGRRDSAGLLAGVAGDKTLPDAVVEQVLAQADGVPLFIEELATTLIESGLLRETAQSYVLDRPLPPLAVPTTLQASLMARLDRLGPVKEVAQIGAVIGREFSHELLAAVSNLSAMDLEAGLDRLTASGLVSRRGAPPIATYAFKHALVQDAAYATLLRTRRRALHASIAELLVERFAAMAESLPELVAHHYSEAGFAAEAIGYWRKAGQRASVRSANREAVSSFERAIALLDAMPQSAFVLEQGIDVRLELRTSLQLLGEGRRFLKRLREAGALAERLGDDRRRGHVGAFMASAHASFGDPEQAIVTGNRALAIARRLGDAAIGMVVTNALEQAHYYRGDYARVVELATNNLAVLPADERLHDHVLVFFAPPSIHDRRWLTFSLAQLGRFAEARGYESEAIRFAEATQIPAMVAYVHHAAGVHHLIAGDWTGARSLVERGITAAQPAHADIMLDQLIASSAWVLAELGETDEALNRLREGEQLLDRHAARSFVNAWNCHGLGRASLRLGLLDEARRLADRTLEASPHHPGFAAHALHLHGDIATHPDRFDAQSGEAYYRQALALAEPRGMRPLISHCHLGLGKLYQRTQKPEQVREHLTTAIALYRDMDMRFWLEQAQAETGG